MWLNLEDYKSFNIGLCEKFLTATRFTPSSVMLDILLCMSVEQTVTYMSMIFVYKLVNGQLPDYLTQHIQRASDIHY